MAETNLTLSIITLNANGLNTASKRQRLEEWIKNNHDSTIYCVKETLQIQRQKQVKTKGQKKKEIR